MKKYIALIAILIALAGGAFSTQQWFVESFSIENSSQSATTIPSIRAEITTSTSTKLIPAPAQQTQTEKTTGVVLYAPETIQAPNVTLSVAGKMYETYVVGDGSVLDTMRSLVLMSDFKFTGRDYPSLGFFVDSINGKKGDSGYYWILYINGTSSNTGASETHLKAGDRVEWRYQKSY